jgi:hypothetical protein
MAGKTDMNPESAEMLDKNSNFLMFLLKMPWNVLLNVSGWANYLSSRGRCVGSSVGLFTPEVALINFDEETSAKLAAVCKQHDIKPFAALIWSATQGYYNYFGRYPARIAQQVSLQRQHYLPANPNRDWVGDWLFGPLQVVEQPYTLEAANEGYHQLMSDIDNMSGQVAEAFEAKAYGLQNAGASGFEFIPPYGLPTRMLSSAIFFNNYGQRTIVPEAEVVHWNWAAPFDLGCNCICVNDKTTMSFATMVHGLEAVTAIRDHAYKSLMGLIDGSIEPGSTEDVADSDAPLLAGMC